MSFVSVIFVSEFLPTSCGSRGGSDEHSLVLYLNLPYVKHYSSFFKYLKYFCINDTLTKLVIVIYFLMD